MVERLKYSTISDIYVKEMFFYDETNLTKLLKVCRDWGITYIPDRNRKQVHKLVNGKFSLQELSDDLICNPTDLLFSDDTIANFQSGNHDEVMFVIENEKIIGVVHIMDYNNEWLYLAAYKLLYQYEKRLRKFLVQRGESDQTLLEWIASNNNKIRTKKANGTGPFSISEIKKRKEFKPFQTQNLSTLLEFSSEKGHLKYDYHQCLKKIKDLRNWIMHSKDLAPKKQDNSLGGPIYSIEHLKNFVHGFNLLFETYEYILIETSHIDPLDQAIKTMNNPDNQLL